MGDRESKTVTCYCGQNYDRSVGVQTKIQRKLAVGTGEQMPSLCCTVGCVGHIGVNLR